MIHERELTPEGPQTSSGLEVLCGHIETLGEVVDRLGHKLHPVLEPEPVAEAVNPQDSNQSELRKQAGVVAHYVQVLRDLTRRVDL